MKITTRDEKVLAAIKSFGVTYEELKNMIDLSSDKDMIYVSGSLIDGFGNPHSDLDIFVVTHNVECIPAQFEYEDYKIKIITKGNQRFDIEYHDVNQVKNIIRRINEYDSNNVSDVEYMSQQKLDFLHRLLIGYPINNEMDFKKIKEKINVLNIQGAIIARRTREFRSHLMDCVGMLMIEDIDSAYEWSKRTFGKAIDVYLASYGETNVTEKWRFRKLKRTINGDQSIYETYVNYLNPNKVIEIKDKKEHIERILGYSNELVSNANIRMMRRKKEDVSKEKI